MPTWTSTPPQCARDPEVGDGGVADRFGAPMKGLQVTSTPPRITAPRDSSATSNTPPIPRALTPIPPPRERAASSAPSSQSGTPRSRLRTPPPHPPPWISPSTTSVADHNPSIPGNLYLIPSAGAVSWSETQDGDDAAMDANLRRGEPPVDPRRRRLVARGEKTSRGGGRAP